MRSLPFRFALLVSSLALAACATNPALRDAERLALYRTHAGEPVPSFQYFGRISGWTPLGESAMAVEARPNQSYLLELQGPCPNLEFAQAISLSGQFGRVYSRFDTVTPLDRDGMNFPCRIEQIRPVDTAAVRQEQREMRDSVETSERSQDSGGT